jgi:hypothetical protein
MSSKIIEEANHAFKKIRDQDSGNYNWYNSAVWHFTHINQFVVDWNNSITDQNYQITHKSTMHKILRFLVDLSLKFPDRELHNNVQYLLSNNDLGGDLTYYYKIKMIQKLFDIIEPMCGEYV